MPATKRLLWIGQPLLAGLMPQSLIGWETEYLSDPGSLARQPRFKPPQVVLVVLPVQGWDAEPLLVEVGRVLPRVPVVFYLPQADHELSFRLGRLGASGCLAGELEANRVAACLEAAAQVQETVSLVQLAEEVAGEPWRELLIGASPAMEEVFEIIRLAGPRRCTVLITGETGTGKELAARALHLASPRARKPLIAVNCAALPEHLLEAELFGHVRGAFTGAVSTRVGRVEQAHGGTLFLDEIGDMPLELQVKLLRVLQERELQRLGSSETIKVDIRVIAATNCDLEARVREGKFRADLFYRLNVVPLRMPPLRERLSDVPLLARHFLDQVCEREGLPPKRISREALDKLCAYDWPGNVRELENAIEMAAILTGERVWLVPADFPLGSASNGRWQGNASPQCDPLPDGGLDYEQVVGAFERSILEAALRRTGGNKKRAAELLRLRRTTFTAKLRSMGLRGSSGRDDGRQIPHGAACASRAGQGGDFQ